MSGGGIHDWIYSFHMPLFFILAGMTYSQQRKNIKSLALRLLMPYVIWSAMATIYELSQLPHIWRSILFINTVNTVTTYGIAPFWFLSSLFISEAILFRIRLQNKGFLIILFLMIIITSILMNRHGYGVLSNVIKVILRNCWATSFVWLGVFIKPLNDKKSLLKWMLPMLIISVYTSNLNTGVNMHKYIIGNPILFLISSIAGSLFIISLSCFICSSQILEWIGRNSIGVMCLHYKTLPIWSVVNCFNSLKGYAGVVLQTILLLLVSLVMTTIINIKFPVLWGRPRKIEMKNGKSVSNTTA